VEGETGRKTGRDSQIGKQTQRELTVTERREIRRLVTHLCANYNYDYGCLPLDGGCHMLGKWWTGSLCKYFESSVLPINPTLERALQRKPPANAKPCAVCGRRFAVAGRKTYCSDRCREQGRKITDAKRARKYRKNKASTVTN
jgi:predicted nucleic acid-binding Zn ribbon protein